MKTSDSRSLAFQSGLIVACMIVLQVIILFFMGRTPVGPGGFGLWTSNAWGVNTSQLLADPYSVSHALHGIIFYFLLWYLFPRMLVRSRMFLALGTEIVWEIFENTAFVIHRYRTATASLNYFGDSIYNSFGDSLFCLLGFWLAYKLPWQVTVALVIAMEVIMFFTIRDNLLLNIIMLIHPIKSIQAWQMALL